MEPTIRIVRGNPTEEEVAAITAVLLSLKKHEDSSTPKRSAWSDRSRIMRKPIDHRTGSWRRWSA